MRRRLSKYYFSSERTYKQYREGRRAASFILLIIMLIVFIAVRFCDYHKRQEIVKSCTEKTVGTISRVDRYYSVTKKSKNGYIGIVEFEVNGQTYHARTVKTKSRLAYNKGDEVVVWYDPSDPSRNCTEGTGDTTATGPAALIMFGFLALIIIVLAAELKRKRKRQNNVMDILTQNTANDIEQPRSYDDIFK